VIEGIGGDVDLWDAHGRLTKGESAVYAWPVWKQILVQRARVASRSSDVSGRTSKSAQDEEIIERLQEEARNALPVRKR
jgi:hypothetical protein